MIEDIAGAAIEVLGELGSASDPRQRRRGCGRWLIALIVISVLLAVTVIALNG